MSLILEALKKSEAERRLGHAPDLLTPARAAPPRRPAWLAGFALGLALALLAVALAAWWFRPAPAPSGAIAGKEEAPDRIAPVPEGRAAQEAPVPIRRSPRPQRIESVPPTVAPAPAPREEAFAARERESIALPAADSPFTLPSEVPPSATPAASATPAPEPAPEPALESLPTLAWFTAAERDGLPPLRLSMHVYDANPQARFALIDGHRLRQGDAVTDGLQLAEIRPDGVVLDWRGRRFLLPRP